MNQLVLSSQRLKSNKILNSGILDVFELLQQHESLDCVKLSADIPEKGLFLHWNEVLTPAIPLSFKDLVGKKLLDYKFQYLGQFKFDNTIIEPESESFKSDFPDRNIHNCEIESTGWVNCSWLVDFLLNAKDIQENSLRSEMLFWKKEQNNLVLSLSVEAMDMRSAEQQKFIFGKNFSSIIWQHNTLFGN